MDKKYNIFLGLTALLYVIITKSVLTVSPLPWPDEAVYADIAINWLENSRLTTNLWQGMIPGIETTASWNPPGYFYLTAVSFRLFGANLLSQRMVSAFFGLISLFLVIDISRRLNQKINFKTLGLLSCLLLFDYQYMIAARLARAEIVIISLGLFSWWLMLRWSRNTLKFSWLKSLILGIIPGLSGLLHPLGFSMAAIGLLKILIEWFKKKKTSIRFSFYSAGVLLPVTAWFISISPVWELMWQQVQLAGSRKVLEESWVMLSYLLPIPRLAIVFSLLGLVLIYVIKNAYKSDDLIGWYVTLLAVCFSLLVLAGRMMWYTVYALPFVYIAYIYWLGSEPKKSKYPLYLGLCLAVAQAYMTWTNLYLSPISKGSYPEYCSQILSIIPENKTVFMSATPDPYYCFLENNRQNRLLEFPVLDMPKTEYGKVLANVDYVIFQKSYDQILFQDFLVNYINFNHLQATKVYGSSPQHQALVYQLKPSDSRFIPQK